MDEIETILFKMLSSPDKTFDLQNDEWVDKSAILDSSAAVLEAIRNSVSISTLLGTLGGIVVFKRDTQMDVADSKDLGQFMKDLATGETLAAEEANE